MDFANEIVPDQEKAFEQAKISVQVHVIELLNKRLNWNLDGNALAIEYINSGMSQICRDLMNTDEEVKALLRSNRLKEASVLLVEKIIKEQKVDEIKELAA